MKVVHCISSLDKSAGGPSNSVSNLNENLWQTGLDSEIYTLDTGNEIIETCAPMTRFDIGFSRKLGHSPGLKQALMKGLSERDILHNHGLWMLPNIYPGAVKQRTGCKLVLAPRGTLAAWSLQQSKWKKKLAGFFGQWTTLQRTDCFHATSEQEYEDIRRLGFRQPVAVIPNGINMPSASFQTTDLSPVHVRGQARDRHLVYLGRIHPQKGIDRLLDIWPTLARERPGWKLILCGPGEPDYVRSVIARIQSLQGSVEYAGPVWGVEKSQRLFRSAVFILPSESENFGISVAEALAHGLPAIVSREAPWAGLNDYGCGWWVNHDNESYRQAISAATALSLEALARMGQIGAQWMARDFSWTAITASMQQTYDWLHGRADPPDCVHLD